MKCPAEIVLHQSHRDIRRQAAKQIASACPTANAPRCCRKPERRDISNRAANAGSLSAIRHLTVQPPPDILSARRSAKPPPQCRRRFSSSDCARRSGSHFKSAAKLSPGVSIRTPSHSQTVAAISAKELLVPRLTGRISSPYTRSGTYSRV